MPRGVSKERADLDGWFKTVFPSPDLRKWFGHKPERFDEFKAKYLMELDRNDENREEIHQLLDMSEKGMVMLLYGEKSHTVNHAIVLRDYLTGLSSKT